MLKPGTLDASKPRGKGRPSDYTPERAAQLCDYLSSGMSLRTACAQKNMPEKATVFRWLSLSNPKPWAQDFRDQYARAKEEAADALVEEMLDIADDTSGDTQIIKSKKGNEYPVLNSEFAQRSRIRIDTRKWIASKLKPKKYGDKLDVTSGGKELPAPIYGGVSARDANAADTTNNKTV